MLSASSRHARWVCIIPACFASTILGESPRGSVVGWGIQVGGVDLSQDFIAVAGGEYHSLGLRADGSIVGWGANGYKQLNVPSPNADFIAVAAGGLDSLGLKANGSIVEWGNVEHPGEPDIPVPNTGFVAIAAGGIHSLGLKADGAIVGWGDNYWGALDVPTPNSDFIAIAAGSSHSLVLCHATSEESFRAADGMQSRRAGSPRDPVPIRGIHAARVPTK